MNAELAKLGFHSGFAMWINTGTVQSDPWPFALVGPHKRPVDAWATICGEVVMGRGDPISWLTLPEYLDARQKAATEAVGRLVLRGFATVKWSAFV
jgi:hypothetical protein